MAASSGYEQKVHQLEKDDGEKLIQCKTSQHLGNRLNIYLHALSKPTESMQLAGF